MVNVDKLITKIQDMNLGFDETRIRFAFSYAKIAHEGQKRFSGEPYITHPLEVAFRVLDFYPDEDMVVAALLHDVSEDTDFTLEDIESKFGPAVRNLVFGLEKLSKVRSKLNEPEIENLRKMFLSMASDIRVIIIKLCDRWHNMETLDHVRPEKQRRIATETLEIYAPISSRLGIYKIKGCLEDLCFKYLNPQMYKIIKLQMDTYTKRTRNFIKYETSFLEDFLIQSGFDCTVTYRLKNLFSIYNKLKRKGCTSVDELYDVFALRIVLNDDDISKLYQILGLIHNKFTPIPERFKDYVAMPKTNGYQSLHTALVGLNNDKFQKPVEIQIRNKRMHLESEFGVACHWSYKEQKEVKTTQENTSFRLQTDWIKSLINTEHDLKNNKEFLEYLHIDALNDRIFILTPDGHVKDLPKGSTPVDFAYSVHTDLGNFCYMAKVNGAVAPLDAELRNGDVVEILTRKNSEPNRYWLSFVITSSARQKIKAFLRSKDKQKNIKIGKDLLNKELKRYNKPLLDTDCSILKKINDNYLSAYEPDVILEEIGYGRLTASQVFKEVYPIDQFAKKETQTLTVNTTEPVNYKTDFKVKGFSNIPFKKMKCCDVKKGDPIHGYIVSGKAIAVHKKACKHLLSMSDEYKIAIFWANVDKKIEYYVNICIELEDRPGFLRDVTTVIFTENVNISDISLNKDMAEHIDYKMRLLELNVKNYDQLERIMSKIQKIKGVIDVYLV